ncbi:hypothetical protein [Roseovarius sp. ZX-A-9]|uniref:hypothetical protein n=1 Tax=Roseovarius sp. ZX-A-9 TaxID=3014783 RepID=UPI00232ADF90|nr:hypothetical protein [Roseovarius sp. ZX-A-9]
MVCYLAVIWFSWHGHTTWAQIQALFLAETLDPVENYDELAASNRCRVGQGLQAAKGPFLGQVSGIAKLAF